MDYPATRRAAKTERLFDVDVADPYRWLEADARSDAQVGAWVREQDALTRSYLASLPGRGRFRQRLAELFDHARLTAPRERGGRYFYTRNAGLAQQAVLLVRSAYGLEEGVLLDPNTWSDDGATALAEWAVSPDGRYVAFARQDGGTDWRTIRVLDVDHGTVLGDVVSWARFTTIAWTGDGSGFFYSRFPEPAAKSGFEAPVTDHAVFYHALGSSQADDRRIHSTPPGQVLIHTVDATPDGRYLLIYSTPGAGSNAVHMVDLQEREWTARPVVTALGHNWSYAGNEGARLLLLTDHAAERGRIVAIDLDEVGGDVVEVVPEDAERTISDAALLGGRLLVTRLADGRMEMRRYRTDGTDEGAIALPGIGTAGGFQGRPDQDEAFFVFTGYDAPTTICRYTVSAGSLTVWAAPEVAIDLEKVIVEQRFYASKDGTRIPLTVVRRAASSGPAPTILYGYGGYGISMVPHFRPDVLAWVEAGGAYAVAGLRGGGEYGKAWHDAGRLANKQNVFDDFIAAAEHLVNERIAPADGLAIQGESNGGLLVGAVVNQRPELFAAALPGVGVMDMLRFTRFTNGRFWTSDYGDPEQEADFRTLLSYSPYHNIRSGTDYPAILVSTADTDDRVVPAHSFKYAAALQAAELGDRPHLLRVDTRAGHGGSKPMDKIIDEVADMWAFAARWTGLPVP